MMVSLFSSFDPTSSISIVPNWVGIGLILLVAPKVMWLAPTKSSIVLTSIASSLHKESKLLLSGAYAPGTSMFFITLFGLIAVNNLLGLTPYVFTATSHILVTLILALPLWALFMIYGWTNSTMVMFAHLVPSGTPPALMAFMVLIETVSNVIRPITLSVRLAANMVAGHLLMTLLGNQGVGLASTAIPLLVGVQILLVVLESAVALIQAYVFTTLTTLYASEVN